MNYFEAEIYTYDDGDRIWLGVMQMGMVLAYPFTIQEWLDWLDKQEEEAMKYRIPDSVLKAFGR